MMIFYRKWPIILQFKVRLTIWMRRTAWVKRSSPCKTGPLFEAAAMEIKLFQSCTNATAT